MGNTDRTSPRLGRSRTVGVSLAIGRRTAPLPKGARPRGSNVVLFGDDLFSSWGLQYYTARKGTIFEPLGGANQYGAWNSCGSERFFVSNLVGLGFTSLWRLPDRV